jgi:hypothetical protein
MERAARFTHTDTEQVKLDKLDAVLALASTSKQDAALFAEMLSLPNDGRYPARSTVRPNASRLVGSVQCASSKIISTGFLRANVSTCAKSDGGDVPLGEPVYRQCGYIRPSNPRRLKLRSVRDDQKDGQAFDASAPTAFPCSSRR